MTTAEKLANAVDQARYCHYDRENETLIVWNGSLTFNIYSVETGSCVGMWTSGDDLGLTPEKYDDGGWRLVAAIDNIRETLSPAFAAENNGMTYLEAYAG